MDGSKKEIIDEKLMEYKGNKGKEDWKDRRNEEQDKNYKKDQGERKEEKRKACSNRESQIIGLMRNSLPKIAVISEQLCVSHVPTL